jgi:hypothetical protein
VDHNTSKGASSGVTYGREESSSIYHYRDESFNTTHGREDSYGIAHDRDTKHHMLIHLSTCYEKNCYGFSFDFVTYGFI